jgi:hypothetical protein
MVPGYQPWSRAHTLKASDGVARIGCESLHVTLQCLLRARLQIQGAVHGLANGWSCVCV